LKENVHLTPSPPPGLHPQDGHPKAGLEVDYRFIFSVINRFQKMNTFQTIVLWVEGDCFETKLAWFLYGLALCPGWRSNVNFELSF
jgi:hypothetical protein